LADAVQSSGATDPTAQEQRLLDLETLSTSESHTDEHLVRRVLAGESACFELIMRRNNQRVYRAVRSIVGSDDEAQDVMQEAYVNAFTHLADFGGRSRFSTWLTRIAVHEAFARARRGKRTRPLDEDRAEEQPMAPSVLGPEQRASDRELGKILERAIDTLPEAFRAVFVLRQVQQLSVAETAEILGVPEETVKTRLHRARGLLRAALTERIGAAVPNVFDFHLARCDRVVAGVFARLEIAR
jgi:RNA polymerase sigma-70 factor (ECF subfamily)